MNKSLKKLTILVLVSLMAVGGILGGLSATATAQSADEDALKAEVQAAVNQWVLAFQTSDAELFDSLYLQSDKTTYISASSPFRVDGWTDIRAFLAGFLTISINTMYRQSRFDFVGDDVAIHTAHWVVTAGPNTLTGRITEVRQKVDGEWLIVHQHLSPLPE